MLSSFCHCTILATLLLHNFLCRGVYGATFTFTNKCSKTIWPGILGSPALESTGFELPKGNSRVVQAPSGWSGRFWGRTGCNFDDSGSGSCSTGDCSSNKIECNGAGTTAATLVEFTLGSGTMDFYDVSLVDGYNLPVTVEARGGSGECESTGCEEDLNERCPNELKIDGGNACRSACDAFGTPEYCCKGEYGSPATCQPSGYSQLFKSACPKSYSFAYDDSTSTFTCTGADYVITFCPSLSGSTKSSKSDNGTEVRSGSATEGVSGTGPVQGATMMADGSWVANLATGGSSRPHFVGASVQILALLIALVHLTVEVIPFQW